MAPPLPGAGNVLKQVESSSVPALVPAGPVPLRIEPPAAVAGDYSQATAPIAVKTIELSGNTIFATATLKSLVAEAEGSTLTLAQLNELVKRITAYYRIHGHPLDSAYLPQQTMDGGLLRIVVIEAVYGRVKVDNRSHVDTARLEAYAAALQPGQFIEQAPLDRTLLLLRELAGVDVTANASPGATSGSSDLTITAVDTARTAGTYSLDGFGSKATGRQRVIVSVDVNNLLRRGESFSATAVTSAQGLNYGRVGVQGPIDGTGGRAGLGYALLSYKLGDSFGSLDANGSAAVLDGFVQQALLRSTQATVDLDFRAEHKVLSDRVDTTAKRTDRTLTNVTAGVSGDVRDDLGGGGRSTFSLNYTRGHVAFNDVVALGLDQASNGPKTQGDYDKVSLEASRLQSLGTKPALAGTSLFASVRGQKASTNLDSSEQLSIAGPQGVRGYDVNSLSGAIGYAATLELRQALVNNASGSWQAKLFADMGHITIYKNVFSALQNSAWMRSAGASLSWAGPAGWNGQLSVAQPYGTLPAIAAERKTRLWFLMGGKF